MEEILHKSDLLTGSPIYPTAASSAGLENNTIALNVAIDESINLDKECHSDFGLCWEMLLLTDSPLPAEDGRESLGILPQFKNRLGLQSKLDEVLEDPENFLITTGSNCEANALELLKQEDELENPFLKEFQQQCEAIEMDEYSSRNPLDSSDEHYSMYVEANYLASKIADNSILDISQEGASAGTILDRTPQPEFVEEDSICHQKVDTQLIYKQLDKMLPPDLNLNSCPKSIDRAIQTLPIPSDLLSVLHESKKSNVNTILEILTTLKDNCSNVKVDLILSKAILELVEVYETSDKEEEDSGHSSTENDKKYNLSLKASSTDNAKALDLSLKSKPQRLSITFSHQNDPALPDKQQSNNLKQQTAHMKRLWGSVNTTIQSSEGSSVISNDSKSSSVSAITKTKLKPKSKNPEAESRRKGPLKADVPLASLNTSTTRHVSTENHTQMRRPRTPTSNLRPVAQSTPEDFVSKRLLPVSPLARPTRRLTNINMNQSKTEKDVSLTTTQKGNGKTLIRGCSETELKPSNKSKLSLRRAYSISGKENLSIQPNCKSSEGTRQPLLKAPPSKNYKNCMKPFNLAQKIQTE